MTNEEINAFVMKSVDEITQVLIGCIGNHDQSLMYFTIGELCGITGLAKKILEEKHED